MKKAIKQPDKNAIDPRDHAHRVSVLAIRDLLQ